MIDFETIKRITEGAAYVTEEEGCLQFHRFTRAEEAYYEELYRLQPAWQRQYATSGIKLCFLTNSRTLSLALKVEFVTPTEHFSIDLLSDGKMIGSIRNFEETPSNDAVFGRFEGEFSLGDGEKKITLVFPWSVNCLLEKLTLDDGAYITPCKKSGKMITYGDSITYGASALFPSNRPFSRIAEDINAEEICKGIGGEVFCPDLLTGEKEEGVKCIAVAYGTNEICREMNDFKHRASLFFERLIQAYPTATVFVLSPIWRKECEMPEYADKIKTVKEHLRAISDSYESTAFIDGIHFVPHEQELFADACLHPNDRGFSHYYENLKKEILQALDI